MKILALSLFVILFSLPALADDAIAQKVEAHLNTITTLTADFTQVDPEGNVSGGKFYLKRPGKFKWEYDQRQPVLIISDGSQLVYYDKKLKESTYTNLKSSLAGFLARKDIKFSGDVKLLKAEEKDGQIIVKVTQRKKSDEGTLTMVFSQDLKLTGLVVEDSNGYVTNVTFQNEQLGQDLADSSFVFHDPKYSKNVWEKD